MRTSSWLYSIPSRAIFKCVLPVTVKCFCIGHKSHIQMTNWILAAPLSNGNAVVGMVWWEYWSPLTGAASAICDGLCYPVCDCPLTATVWLGGGDHVGSSIKTATTGSLGQGDYASSASPRIAFQLVFIFNLCVDCEVPGLWLSRLAPLLQSEPFHSVSFCMQQNKAQIRGCSHLINAITQLHTTQMHSWNHSEPFEWFWPNCEEVT